jgi:predicted metal-dependent phosphoesterase TrpH
MLRTDLHVHSWQSRQSGSLRFLKSRDCYSRPEDVYRVAKARGMDLVTITDHDSIDGCLELLERYPGATDIFISEEVSCRLPDGDIEVHLGVYGTDERLHRELQPLRRNVFDVIACLREAGVFFALNHLLHFYRRQIPLETYLRLVDHVPAVEARNGAMLEAHNVMIERLARSWRGGPALGMTGGSDAHTLRRVGRTWTEAPGDSPATFLQSLKDRQSRVGGVHGDTLAVTADAYGVVARYCASLAGLGPRDHHGMRRAACLAFSVVSLPAQFLPLVLVGKGKRQEAREVEYVDGALGGWLGQASQAAGFAPASELESGV